MQPNNDMVLHERTDISITNILMNVFDVYLRCKMVAKKNLCKLLNSIFYSLNINSVTTMKTDLVIHDKQVAQLWQRGCVKLHKFCSIKSAFFKRVGYFKRKFPVEGDNIH